MQRRRFIGAIAALLVATGTVACDGLHHARGSAQAKFRVDESPKADRSACHADVAAFERRRQQVLETQRHMRRVGDVPPNAIPTVPRRCDKGKPTL
jgi:hypothetical protein